MCGHTDEYNWDGTRSSGHSKELTVTQMSTTGMEPGVVAIVKS